MSFSCSRGAVIKCQCQTKENPFAYNKPYEYIPPKFNLGDRVYSPMFGWGLITGDYDNDFKKHRIFVNAEIDNSLYGFWIDGKYDKNGEVLLFHDKPQIIPPKKKVKKWYWVSTIEFYSGFERRQNHAVSTLRMTEEEFLQIERKNYSLVGYCKLPWTEVEEEE